MGGLYPAGEVLVTLLQVPSGRIGFDLCPEGESLFGSLIGGGYSWLPEGHHRTRLNSETPTSYVRNLLVRGFNTPITLSSVEGSEEGIAAAFRTLESMAMMDSDGQTKEYCQKIASLLAVTARLCVHSIPQWVTTLVVTEKVGAMEMLRNSAALNSVGFESVGDETKLPNW